MLKLRARTELTARELEPTGQQTIQKMMAKGWLEHGVKPSTYRITAAGDEALRAPLPDTWNWMARMWPTGRPRVSHNAAR